MELSGLIDKISTEVLLKDVERLLYLGKGDSERLKHIRETIHAQKTLYQSDKKYVEHLSLQFPIQQKSQNENILENKTAIQITDKETAPISEKNLENSLFCEKCNTAYNEPYHVCTKQTASEFNSFDALRGSKSHHQTTESHDKKFTLTEEARALKHIRNAWIAGIFASAITVIMVTLEITGVYSFMGDFDGAIFGLIDVVAITSLTFGIYKKSRFAAIIMFVYFVASKLMMLQDVSASGTFVIPALILGYYFFQGIRGTLTSHKIKMEKVNIR